MNPLPTLLLRKRVGVLATKRPWPLLVLRPLQRQRLRRDPSHSPKPRLRRDPGRVLELLQEAHLGKASEP